jgi:hypothetical protein
MCICGFSQTPHESFETLHEVTPPLIPLTSFYIFIQSPFSHSTLYLYCEQLQSLFNKPKEYTDSPAVSRHRVTRADSHI